MVGAPQSWFFRRFGVLMLFPLLTPAVYCAITVPLGLPADYLDFIMQGYDGVIIVCGFS